MPPNSKGKYATTTRMKILHYKGKKYKLYTCCTMCANMMNELSKNNVKKFDREHKVKKTKKGDLKLANRVTKKYVQIAKQV
jgi:cytidine deaminase